MVNATSRTKKSVPAVVTYMPVALIAARFALALLIVATLTGCGKAPQLERLGPDAVVLAFGDSLTFGTGADETRSYPAVLAGLIGRTVVRSGAPGEVSARGLERLPAELETHRPKLVILCHGGNDLLRRMDRGRIADNLRAMIRLSKSRGADVLLIGTPEPGITVSPPGFYKEIAGEFAIPYEGDVMGKILRDANLKSDLIHPNAQGYALIAARVAELLKKSGAL